ncbi:MAG: addiction module toxin RelE [Sediminibacterium sp.]|nr:MAG: addiction module toxin RelE [Sediminibacterium sp.] [Sediminibacterium sp. FEMGT703S]
MSRKLSTYGKYFFDFYNKLDEDLQEKIDWVFELIKSVDHIPKKYFQHVENSDGLFEIRIEFESNIYRIFCFFDEGNLVILINAFQKKSQKTPKSELDFAKNLKKQYFIDKKLSLENEKGINKKNKR